jgi:hypothetical protein
MGDTIGLGEPAVNLAQTAKKSVVSSEIPVMRLGERCFIELAPPPAFRAQRLAVKLEASFPARDPYFKKIGGSKRKGQLASMRFAADTLYHASGRWIPGVVIENVSVGRNAQMEQGTRAPAVDFAAPLGSIVDCEPCKDRQVMHVYFANLDFSRDAWGVCSVIGDVL